MKKSNLKKKTVVMLLLTAIAGSLIIPGAVFASTSNSQNMMKAGQIVQAQSNVQNGELPPSLPNGEQPNGELPPEMPSGEMQNGQMQNEQRQESSKGMEMRDGSFVPDEDDDGTKYPKPDGENQMQEGERPELPKGETSQGENGNNNGMEMKDGSFVPDEDDAGTKYPKTDGESQMQEGEIPEMSNGEQQNNQDQNYFQMLQKLPQDFVNWLKGLFGGNE